MPHGTNYETLRAIAGAIVGMRKSLEHLEELLKEAADESRTRDDVLRERLDALGALVRRPWWRRAFGRGL